MTDKDKIKQLEKQVKRMSSIEIPLTDDDCYSLIQGESFNWSFNGVDVHLFQEEDYEEANV